MSDGKGKGLHDEFYRKAQAAALKSFISGKRPVATDWSSGSYFLTFDRVAFYVVPNDLYGLKESFYSPCRDLYGPGSEFLSERLIDVLKPAALTGNRFADPLPGGKFSLRLEVSFDAGSFQVFESALSLFPKKRLYAVSGADGPLFVLSPFKVLLGGAWPLNLSSKSAGN